MKKNFLKLFLMAGVVAIMAACGGGGLDSKISDLEKACKNGDAEKAWEIINELDEEYDEDDLSASQRERIEKASVLLYQNMSY